MEGLGSIQIRASMGSTIEPAIDIFYTIFIFLRFSLDIVNSDSIMNRVELVEVSAMAENESLDLRLSRRWQRLLKAVIRNKRESELKAIAYDCLYKTAKALQKGKHCVSFSQLLDARDQGPDAMQSLIIESGGDQYAQLFLDTSYDAPSNQIAISNLLAAALDGFSDQISIHACAKIGQRKLIDVSSCLDRIKADLEGSINHIAKRIADDPQCRLVASRKHRPQMLITTETILGESLLGVGK